MAAVSPASARFPQSVAWTVLLLCAAPPLLNLLGVDFGTKVAPFDPREYTLLEGPLQSGVFYRTLRGAFVFTLLEWTAFCVALVTVTFSFVHYFLTRDLITPIVGTALFFSGCVDAFHVLAADLITEEVSNHEQFVPWVWTLSRLLNSLIVVAGAVPFLWTERRTQAHRGLRYTLLTGLLCALASYALVHVLADVSEFPTVLSAVPNFVHRPLDLIPLGIYLLAAGIVLPRLYRKHRSLFARGLQVSILPHVVSQVYAVGSAELYDNAFNIASGLKIVGYLVPLVGLLIDYSYAYRAQAALRAAEEQLHLARDIQQRLLPAAPPRVASWSIAGRCAFAEAIGGDYFDYLTLPDGRVWIIVADVSGHDPGASLLMANARSYLRAVSLSSADLESAVRHVNRFLCDDGQGRRFVTLFAAALDPRSPLVEYIGAGHAALLVRADGRCESLDATGMPLGVTVDYEIRSQCLTDLQPGDLLLLTTDGLLEAMSPSGELFSRSRVEAVLRASPRHSPSQIVQALFDGVQSFTQTSTFRDDVTAVVALRQPAE